MDITETLIVITTLYCILLFFDQFFKSCMHKPYLNLLNGTGVKIKFLQISCETTAFNRVLLRWANNSHYLHVWFTWGLYTSLILLPIAASLLLIAIAQSLLAEKVTTSKSAPSALIIEPLIPGVNLPASEMGYYAFSLIVSSIVHEAGHALAAVKEDVHIVNVGIYVLYILPVAYVNLSSEKLNSIGSWRALKVLCAGVWHNLVFSLIAYFLYCTLPFIYSAVFHVHTGVYVKSVQSRSPLAGPRGFEAENIITNVNLCPVYNEDTLIDCLQKSLKTKPGYCVNAEVIHNFDESVPLIHTKNNGLDCCESTKFDHFCFEYIDKDDGILEIPPHVCLPAREILERAEFTCGNQENCPENLHCIRPLLDNSTHLFKVSRNNLADVIYLGHPFDFMQHLEVSNFVPKFGISHLLFPDIVMKFLAYIIVISTGLALVNIIPCLFMDGQHITKLILEIILKQYPKEYAYFVALFISSLSTLLLVFHCIYTVSLKFT